MIPVSVSHCAHQHRMVLHLGLPSFEGLPSVCWGSAGWFPGTPQISTLLKEDQPAKLRRLLFLLTPLLCLRLNAYDLNPQNMISKSHEATTHSEQIFCFIKCEIFLFLFFSTEKDKILEVKELTDFLNLST